MKRNGPIEHTQMNRRAFLCRTGWTALGLAGLGGGPGGLLAPSAKGQMIELEDYRALVIIFLLGGNDSNNLLIPFGSHPARGDYETGRGVLGLANGQLHLLNYPSAADPQYALHPDLGPLAALFNGGDLAFAANVGSLVEPIPDRQAYLDKTAQRPPQLFSHSSQQLHCYSALPDQPFEDGWGGRTADLIDPIYNHQNNGNVPMSVSLAGVTRLLMGYSVSQYIVSPYGIPQFSSAGYGTNYAYALDAEGNYLDNDYGRRLKAFDDILAYRHRHLLEEGCNHVVRRAREAERAMGGALQEAAVSGVDFDTLFQAAPNNLGRQLKMVAKLIAGRQSLGNRRQFFFCSVGGYDTHAGQLATHANLMTDLGSSLKAFSDTLKLMDIDDNVVTLTLSEFNRTMTPNKEDPASAGSDHGWGGHQIVMGGPVNGGAVYGFFPSLKINADRDAGTDGRGRWIPTTSVEQYQAPAVRWFGVPPGDLAVIFPNLSRFTGPFEPASNLGYLTL